VNRLADSRVGAATADIRNVVVDVVVAWIWDSLQQVRRCHDLAGLTKSALRYVVVEPRFLHGMQVFMAVGKSFDGGYRPTIDTRDWRDAGALGFAVDMYGAGTALADATAEFCACQIEVIAQHPQQWCAVVTVEFDVLGIHLKRNH